MTTKGTWVAVAAGVSGLFLVAIVVIIIVLSRASAQDPEQLAKCNQMLRAAQAREEVWTYPPIGYDFDGRPAVMLRSKYRYSSLINEAEILMIVQATECFITKGKQWNMPITVIYDNHETIARYTGSKIEMLGR